MRRLAPSSNRAGHRDLSTKNFVEMRFAWLCIAGHGMEDGTLEGSTLVVLRCMILPMKRTRQIVGVLLILLGVGLGSYPWVYPEYLRRADPRPYHYYYFDFSSPAIFFWLGVALLLVIVGILLVSL